MKTSKILTIMLLMCGLFFCSCSKDNTVKVTAVNLSQTTVTINKLGDKVNLRATITPNNATESTVTWKTSSSAVATVDNNGNVTAVSFGTATITATAGGMTATCTVNVKPIEVSGVTLSESTLNILIGSKATLTATVTPGDATDGSITWSSSAPAVATVDNSGNVTAVSLGTAVITAKAGEMTATCTVTVKPIEVADVTLSKNTIKLYLGEKEKLTATVTPSNATDGTITWSSSSPSIAKVDNSGNITAAAVGTATITAKAGEKIAKCTVTIWEFTIYAAGYVSSSTNSKMISAMLWKDETATKLSSDNSAAKSVYVSDNNVYVAGTTLSTVSAKLWKNGVSATLLNSSNTYATSVYVYGSDVYVSGYSHSDEAILWKNSVKTVLKSGSGATASFVKTSGSNVYVGGYLYINHRRIPAVWKNGVMTTYDLGNNSAYVADLYISGNDLYVLIREAVSGGFRIKYYKNNVGTYITDGSSSTIPESIFVSGSDVYISGYSDSKATIWKNGTPSVLYNKASFSNAMTISVIDNNVYVAGFVEENDKIYTKIWKNGTVIKTCTLSGISSNIDVSSICIREKL